MPRPIRLILMLLLVCAATALPASAASLGGLDPDRLTGGQATIASCDAAVSVSYATQSGNITSVTIDGIADPSCEGGALTVRALDSADASIAAGGPTTVPTDPDTADNTVSLSLSPQPNAEQVSATAISIAGP